MATTPTKEKVREWQEKRLADHVPPPDPEQIKRELGWNLIQAERANRPKEKP